MLLEVKISAKMEIPTQLKNMRFLRVGFKDKRPFEPAWQKNPYTYDEISKHFPKENYGIICGKEFRALDDDTPDQELIKLYNENFPETMQVRGHVYFKFDNNHEDKIILEHPEKKYPNSKGEMDNHMGEIQGEGTMIVGAGCTHPDGSTYEIKKDLPIITISYEKFEEVFGKFFKKKKKQVIREHISTSWQGDNITDIPIGNIISFNGLTDMGNGSFQGPHPKHGSDGGMNFRVDEINNNWYCFRDQSGGGPSELIAVMEGIIDCGDAGPNCFSQDQGREVINIAREKYGLTTPELEEQDLGPVKGWALSVSIEELAKKYNLTHCPKCGYDFDFEKVHGLYYCKYCGEGGGLKKFAEMIATKLNQQTSVKPGEACPRFEETKPNFTKVE